MSVVKAFFEFCHANEWTSRNPARMVRNQRGQHNDPRSGQKLPFSDEELRRMYDACVTKYGKREIQWEKATRERRTQGRYAQHKSRRTGQDIADFISVSVYTGLRISDREYVPHLPDHARRNGPAQDHQGAHPRLNLGSPISSYLLIMSLLKGNFMPKQTTCSSSLFRPSQKAFAGPTGSQTLPVYPAAALPLPLYECSSFGTSFLLNTCESKKQGASSLLCKFPTD